ncbi:MAG: hypothetical protein A4S14_04335 [Proteobacteria bacterium SG_bin9]|nr:MAG: hypothetical protein A4S14_04335 [Proteobacteria bacterium SG_bin9]
MSALVLYGPTERSDLPRWSAAAIVVVLLHALLIAVGVYWYSQYQNAGTPVPPIMVDLVAVSAAPETQPLDIAPGPTMQEAAEPQPQPDQPVQEFKDEIIPPTPLQEKPVVAAPPEEKKKVEVKPDPLPKPEKPKPVKPVVQKQSTSPPAPKTTAAPQAERRAPAAASAASAASSAAASASYAQRLVAHLQRFKQYPSEARAAGQQGTSRVAFTVTRSGSVSGVRIAGSSGHASLDAETLAMVRRAQPLPSFPPEMTESSKAFVLPMAYFSR